MLTALLYLSLGLFAFGQASPFQARPGIQSTPQAEAVYSPQLRGDLVALRDAALADDYAYRQLAHLTENIGPRPEGSLQAEAAVDYVAGELRKLGLEVRLEEVRVPRWIRGEETAQLVEYPGQAAGTIQKIVLTALGCNTPTPSGGLTAEVVVVNSFDELKMLGRDKVAGKVVLFNTRFDHRQAENGHALDAYINAVRYRVDGPKAAAEQGAVASLVRSVGDADYRLPHTGGCSPAGIPSGAVAAEDADLMAHLSAQGKTRIHLVLASTKGPAVVSHNVIADLKGTEHPEQIVLVSGHLDSWDLGTGAIDDAGGVAVAMQTAQLIRRLNLHPLRTIRVVAWMDEEDGALGRDVYASEYKAEFDNHVAVFESDSGPGHPLGFVAKISPAAAALLHPAQDVLAAIGANLISLSADSPETDIEPEANAGVPAFGVLPDGRTYFRYHHTAADTLDKVPPQDLSEHAAAMAVMVYTAASLPQPLPR
jgi:hypothetical protein